MNWSPGAQGAWTALVKGGFNTSDGFLHVFKGIRYLAIYAVPGESALGSALRDPEIWPDGPAFFGLPDQELGNRNLNAGGTLSSLELSVEQHPRRDSARQVGERHIAAALGDMHQSAMRSMILQPAKLYSAVRDREVGLQFDSASIAGQWHGLIDANIVIHYRNIEHIDWVARTGSKRVTLWVSSVPLEELDNQAYAKPPGTVRHRARAFTSWIKDRVEAAIQPAGSPVRSGVTLRCISARVAALAPDARHLEVAYELRDRGVPIRLLTGDSLMQLRARVDGFSVFEPPNDDRLEPWEELRVSRNP